MTVPNVVVNATFKTAAGDPETGTVSFRLNTPLLDGAGNVIVTRDPIESTLDASGRLTDTDGTTVGLTLAATSGPDLEPAAGVVYQVIEKLSGAGVRIYNLSLPHTDTPVNLADLAPAGDTGLVWTASLTAGDVGDILLAGTNVTITDNLDGTFTIAASGGGGGLTQEQAEDIVGALIDDNSDLDWTYDDATASIVATVKPAVLAGLQPLDSDLTAIAALTTTSYGRAFLALADAAAGRTALGLGTAATTASSAYDVAGAAAAAQAASQPLDSDLTAIAALTTTSYGRALLALADAAAGRTALGLGTAATSASGDFQPIDSDLTAIAALSTTSYGRALLALADAAALRTAAGLVIGTNVQAWDADLDAFAAGNAQTIAGIKTFSADPLIPDEAYGSGWNGVLEPPTKNAVYDKIETLGSPAATPFSTSGGGADYRGLPGWIAVGTGGASAAWSPYDIYTIPIWVPRAITLTGWDLFVNGGNEAAKLVRVGVYAASGSDDAWAVGAEVADGGTVSVATTGAKAMTGLSIALAAGWHVIAVGTNAAALTSYGFEVSHIAQHIDVGLGTVGLVRTLRWFYDYSSGTDYIDLGFPSTLTGGSDHAAAFETSNSPVRCPITLRWSIP